MPPVSAAVRSVITPRLSHGIDGREARAVVNAAAREANPAAAFQAVRDEFGDRFTHGGRLSFERAAAVALLPNAVDATAARAATRETVTAVRGHIRSLNTEIARLEAENARKTQQVDALLTQIEARKAELEREYDRKRNIGILGAVFGMPMVTAASLVMMMDDDSRLRSLNADLSRAKADRASLQQQVDRYVGLKSVLTGRLETLEASARELERLPDTVLPRSDDVARAASSLAHGEALLQNLRSQVKLLEQLRDAARSLGVSLDGALGRLTLELVRAEKMVAQSREATYKLIEIVTSQDPKAAAQKWLDRTVAARTKALLRRYGLDASAFVDHLVKDAFPQGGPAADLLKRQLMQTLTTL